jgi:hypothetical protein
MPSHAGPKTLGKENLVFALDTGDSSNGITPLGCGGFYGSTQGVKDIVNGTIYQFANGMKLTGRNFYTAFAIDYPEGSYGGDAANRNGITPGYDVRSGTKTYDTSRALHLWVWNNKDSSWVADSFFHGYRLYGHCYDTYAGADAPGGYSAELGRFADDFNTIKATFPDCTYIVMGSHRDSYRNSTVRNILYDLGMPTGTALDNNYIDAPEWILVGKPGLGAGNAYGWVYENYQTNPGYVAHMNFGLPIKARGSMEFDGSNDYINLASNIQSGYTQATYEFICKPTSLPSNNVYQQLYIQENSTWIGLYNYSNTIFFGIDLGNGSGWFDNNGGYTTGARTTTSVSANTYYHVVYSWDGTTVRVYLNGVLQSTTSTLQASNGRQNVITLGAGGTPRNIGARGGSNYWVGNMDVVNFYNKALSTSEVQSNYNKYKTRFNLS